MFIFEKIKDNIVDGTLGIISAILITVILPLLIFALDNSKETEEIVNTATTVYEEIDKYNTFTNNICDSTLNYLKLEIDSSFNNIK